MRHINLNLDNDNELENIGDAFSSPIRRKIIRLLFESSHSIQDLASLCDISMSTASFHIKLLKEAGLIKVIRSPSGKGNEKNISLEAESIIIRTYRSNLKDNNAIYNTNIRIGSYTSYDITPPCALCTKEDRILPFDSATIFASQDRVMAELLSFFSGYVEYSVVAIPFNKKEIINLSFNLELCSECPNYNNNWKSDITFWINDVEIGTYRSLGDYGGRKGKYTPNWWGINSSQYGNLLKISITNQGTFFNTSKISDVSIANLNIDAHDLLRFRIGVKKDSKYVGGINLFGKHFGDYNQDITMMVEYR